MRVSKRTGPCVFYSFERNSNFHSHLSKIQKFHAQTRVHEQVDTYITNLFHLFQTQTFQSSFMSVVITSSSSSQNNHNFLLILSFLLLINKKNNNQNKRIVMGLLLSRTLASKFFYPLLFSKKVHNSEFFHQQLENMICLVSPRTGRHLQRYEKGCRQVVGCIPYRYKVNGTKENEIEVLLISAQKGSGMQFPKGGWESDESMEQAALRETIEEAGVIGSVESNLGKWYYKSKRQPTMHEGYMFPLLVSKELDNWPEMNLRKRKWLTVDEAKEICPYVWMKEALDELVSRQTTNSI